MKKGFRWILIGFGLLLIICGALIILFTLPGSVQVIEHATLAPSIFMPPGGLP